MSFSYKVGFICETLLYCIASLYQDQSSDAAKRLYVLIYAKSSEKNNSRNQ